MAVLVDPDTDGGACERAIAELLASTRWHGDTIVHARLAEFAQRLLAATARLNLTAARTPAAVAAHIADALAIERFVRHPLVDVGSGGGFPAIPLAIVTGWPITLIEATTKKAQFLRETLTGLRLGGAVLNARAESVGRDPRERGRYASATARAVGSSATVLELTIPLLAIGGTAVLQRGSFAPSDREAVQQAASILGAHLADDHRQPDGRWVVLVTKFAETGARFPRRVGMAAKRPLS